jgi:hypothetical protein
VERLGRRADGVKNMKRFLSYCLIALPLFLLAIILLPINPRLTKSQLQNMRCRCEVMDIAVGIEKYKSTYQVYPAETNGALWKQLSGDNPQKIVFTAIKARSITTNGEFLDPWGTPYTVSIPTTNICVVTSAGRDKMLGTVDDIIFNSISNNFVQP